MNAIHGQPPIQGQPDQRSDPPSAQAISRLYAGCYTSESRDAIRVFDIDEHGALTQTSAVDAIDDASFLAPHPTRPVIYAVSETDAFGGGGSGGLHAFVVDHDTGALALADEVASNGVAPCYLSVDPSGTYLVAANYVCGTFTAYTLNPDGTFGEIVATHRDDGAGPSPRQEGPHAHCVLPGQQLASGEVPIYGVDLGLDRITRFAPIVDRASGLRPQATLQTEAGAGPRHLRFHPSYPLAAIGNELSSTLAVVAVDRESGDLELVGEHPTLPAEFKGESTIAEVAFHPNGRWVYVSNRGHDSIATFDLDPQCRTLTLTDWTPTGGSNPRHFTLSSDGNRLWAANERSDSIVEFNIDPATGVPAATGRTVDASKPVCLLFTSTGAT